MPQISEKQAEYIRNAHRRWNIKTGATRSGKTYLDVAYTIPQRIANVAGRHGLIVILGNTRGTIQRNIVEPMQAIFGPRRISQIKSDNTASMFGQTVYCLGADSKKHVDRIRGASFAYCYGDEITTWDEDVFKMVQSRLDQPYSTFDGTCNPASPTHWFKAFLDSDADLYSQNYSIDDNPYLDAGFVENLKREYAGTVYFNRYILGQWCAAEGVVYKLFADDPERFTVDPRPDDPKAIENNIESVNIGVDFGGGSSAHAFCATGYTRGMRKLVVLDEYREPAALTPEKLCEAFVQFARRCQDRWLVANVYCDSAEQTLINGLRAAAIKERLGLNISNARKRPINDRIRALSLLMGADRFAILRTCKETRTALQTALWSLKALTEDVRLDDGTTNIDSLDALEYSFERDIPVLVNIGATD